VAGTRNTTGKVVYGTRSTTDTNIRGWSSTMPPIMNLNIAEGRFYTELEDEHSVRVAVVGSDIVDNVLGPGDPLGKEIRVDGAPYTIIGVGESQGKMFGQSMDNWVAIPLMTFLHTYDAHSSMMIYVNTGGGGEVMDGVSDELRVIMRARRHLAPDQPDAFSIDSSATFQNLLGNILNNFGAVVVAIAAISLVIGGIVIMNIMLVTVTERTREIGVRKALGAKRKDILMQFLIESALLASIGGVIGVLVGIGLAKVLTLAIGFPSVVALWSIAVGLLVSASVGLFFGIYPAHKASALDPIAALRAEL
jgi:putative ABC transport system permease protein